MTECAMTELVRYARIDTKLKREFVLLQGTGCVWKHCTFCDYHSDVSAKPFEVNADVLAKVTGEYGVLDVINSGSAMELDPETLALLKFIVQSKRIRTLWFEAHYLYRGKLAAFAAQFPGVDVKFRCGVESFNPLRRKAWNKGIPENVTPQDIAKYFKGACILACVAGQTPEEIRNDIETAKRYFEYFSVNVFCDNTTPVRRDPELVRWFVREMLPEIKDDDRIEVLLENTDLGVG